MSRLSFNHLQDHFEWRYVLVGTALFTAGLLTRGLVGSSETSKIIESPLKTLVPSLSDSEREELPYRLDSVPGARDVDSPYGSLRVYEFGPTDGRKVLFVHGISTPCLSLVDVAEALVKRGCRVMLFDLFGRGYSDTPADLPQDLRLCTTQILLALASSPLSWTGADSDGFSLVGYSLGGGISAGFYSYFPDLVKSLVLIAPSGLIRERHISRTSRLLYSKGVIPEPLLLRALKYRLQSPIAKPIERSNLQEDDRAGAADVLQAESSVEGGQAQQTAGAVPRNIIVQRAVAHQVLHHQGFVPAFMSSIRYGPVQQQRDIWRRTGARLTQINASSDKKQKIFVILGERDPIIQLDEIREDATEALEGNVEFVVMDAGHEAPVTKGKEVADHIWRFWHP